MQRQTKNEWYNLNKKGLENLRQGLVETSYRNDHEDMPIKQIIGYIDGAVMEICKLQKEKEDLSSKLNAIKKE